MRWAWRCQNSVCEAAQAGMRSLVKNGFYHRDDDAKKIQRFRCKVCRKSCSTATFTPTYRQKKRRINAPLLKLYSSLVCQRRAATIIEINRKTIAARIKFFGMLGRQHLADLREQLTGQLDHVHFDEMQTSEHTKCKPISIPLSIAAPSRLILSIGVASMPAQHPLIEKSLRKYGPRPDDRPQAIEQVLQQTAPLIKPGGIISSDCADRYPDAIRRIIPHAVHIATKSRKAHSYGQGELKKGAFDPLFSINHAAAMIRAGMSRLVRRTWVTTKKIEALNDHLAMYALYHNTYLIGLG